MLDYTPDTVIIRGGYVRGMQTAFGSPQEEHIAVFDRWLARHDAEVARAAAKEAEAERDAALSTIAKVREILSRDDQDDERAREYLDLRGRRLQIANRTINRIEASLGSAPSTGEGDE